MPADYPATKSLGHFVAGAAAGLDIIPKPGRDRAVFKLGESQFNQNTFYGRWRHFLDVIDPRTLLTTKKDILECRSLLDKHKEGCLPTGTTNAQLWHAQKTTQAVVHPDTGETIPLPFRMAGFVPFGAPIAVALMLPNPSLASVVFWQWVNQSHNAGLNYCNRNATKPTPTSRFITGYVGAVTSAVGIAVGLTLLIKRANTLSPAMKMFIQKFIPFPAVAAASTCNVVLMRNSELSSGIEVYDENGCIAGTSKIAAKKALLETATTRALLPAPVLIIPPLIMTLLERSRILRNPRMYVPVNAVFTTLTFGLALPVAIAIFPQMSQIKREKIEEEIQKVSQSRLFVYNKGL